MSASTTPSARHLLPATTPQTLLAALRSDDAAARETAHRSLAFDPAAPDDAPRATTRAALTAALAGMLLPTDHALTRWLLEQEIAAQTALGSGATETLLTLVAALARYADPEDALTLWRAREATPETCASVDVEQLARAGVDRVRRHLSRLAREGAPDAEEAAQALTWLERGVATGATDDLPAYFAWSDERFGLDLDCATCRFEASTAIIPAE